ncbi:hypothetical protein [Massilia sp. ST3]|uniref:hypothetical protein n=1 Tax=Massilia sp. ST3 TaxID=2824903 RepID=UPI001B844785|nr:hypothetical protein [Massilia sp. ST3]MBQ5950506.1 hypothetical protein [Massilia sp. ST3]
MPSHSVITTLRSLSWSELAGYAFAALLMGQLTVSFAPASIEAVLRQAALAIPLVLIAAKDLAHAPDAWRRLRSALAERGPWHRCLTALLPPELVGMARLDRLMWQGCLNRLRRRPHADLPDGVALTYLERGAYGTAAAIAFVSVFVELPLDAMIVNLFITDPADLLVVHTLCAFGALYTLVWVLGDRWLVGAGRHVLTGDALHLHVGARASGVLPLEAIERLDAVNELLPTWRRKRGVARGDMLVVTPFDKPNCVLVLRPEARVDILHWQVRKRLPRYVFLYLDRPELLAARLRERSSSASAAGPPPPPGGAPGAPPPPPRPRGGGGGPPPPLRATVGLAAPPPTRPACPSAPVMPAKQLFCKPHKTALADLGPARYNHAPKQRCYAMQTRSVET